MKNERTLTVATMLTMLLAMVSPWLPAKADDKSPKAKSATTPPSPKVPWNLRPVGHLGFHVSVYEDQPNFALHQQIGDALSAANPISSPRKNYIEWIGNFYKPEELTSNASLKMRPEELLKGPYTIRVDGWRATIVQAKATRRGWEATVRVSPRVTMLELVRPLVSDHFIEQYECVDGKVRLVKVVSSHVGSKPGIVAAF